MAFKLRTYVLIFGVLAAMPFISFNGIWNTVKIGILKNFRIPLMANITNDAERVENIYLRPGEIAEYKYLKSVDNIYLSENSLLYVKRLKELPPNVVIKPNAAIHYYKHYTGSDGKANTYLLSLDNAVIVTIGLILLYLAKANFPIFRAYRDPE